MPRALSSEIPFNIPGFGAGSGWGGEPPRGRGVCLLLVILAIVAGNFFFLHDKFRETVNGIGQKAVSIVPAQLVNKLPASIRPAGAGRYVAVSDGPVQPDMPGPWGSRSSQGPGSGSAGIRQSEEEARRALVEAFDAGQVVMK
jgi:hypothetical protein